MVTSEIFDNLKALQDILVKKNELEAKDNAAPKQLQNQEDSLLKTQKEYMEQKTLAEATEEKVAKLKVELDETVKMREEGEKGVANSTTHREYEALEKQITEAKDKEDEVRRELQKEEKELAGLNEKLKNSLELIDFQKTEYETSKKSIDDERAGYKAELDKLAVEEGKITPNLEQEIVFKLQRIIQRNKEGIVAVRNGVCTGCHMILPANFANEVREGDSIKFCPYCSRILFYEEVSEDQAEDYSDIGAAGSLAGFDDDDEFFGDEDEFEEVSEENEEFDDTESEVDDDENESADDEFGDEDEEEDSDEE